MAGNVVDLGNGKYRIRVSIGSGKDRQTFSKNIEASSMREAEKEKTLFTAKVLENQVSKSSNITFLQLVNIWKQDYGDRKLAPKTRHTYYLMLDNRIIPVLGRIKINKLTPKHLNAFYRNLEEPGIRMDVKEKSYTKNIDRYKHWIKVIHDKAEKYCRCLTSKEYEQVKRAEKEISLLEEKLSKSKTLSSNTVNYHHKIISSILGKAVKWGYICNNPAENSDPATIEQKEKTYIKSEDELDKILVALSKEPLNKQALILLDIFSGLRREELVALKWVDNIDLDNGIVKVTNAMQYIPGEGVNEGSTKTKKSKRTVHIPPFVVDILKKYRKQYLADGLAMGDKWHDYGYVFVQKCGKPMHPDTPSKWFPKFLKRNGLDHINFHGLRHTYASMTLDVGADIGAASEALGHAQKSTFLNIYAHTFSGKNKTIADALDKKYSDKAKILDTTLDTNIKKKDSKRTS